MTAPIRPERPLPKAVGQNIPATFEDSLRAIAGSPLASVSMSGPNTVLGKIERLPGGANSTLGGFGPAAGYYLPTPDVVVTDRTLSPSEHDRVLAHEYAHHLASKQSPAVMAQFLRVAPAANPGSYAATSPREHFADAFAEAVDFLRRTSRYANGDVTRPAGQPDALATQIIRNEDTDNPGAAAIVRYLLTQPLYANHPLRGRANLTDGPSALPPAPSVVPQRDVTVVARNAP